MPDTVRVEVSERFHHGLMTGREIRSELVRLGVKQADIARQLKLSPGFISDVIAGNRKSQRVQRAVARAIEKPVHEVFIETLEKAS